MSKSIDHLDSLLLVAGMSGAGKSSAMDVLSDSGYYCIDNLPAALLEQFIELSKKQSDKFNKAALLVDIDSVKDKEELLKFVKEQNSKTKNLTLIFLDADTPTIIKRYSETRRPHPGFDQKIDKSLEDAIQRERSRLQPLKEVAHHTFETSSFTPHIFKRELRAFIDSTSKGPSCANLRLNFLSFGFKYGVPLDCDLIADVRFLKNPYFVDSLREKTGFDLDVSQYVLGSEDALSFIEKYANLLNFLLPKYVFEGKAYLNVGIGCTGGKHRSVTIANELNSKFSSTPYQVSVKHRDVDRPKRT